MKFRIEPYGNNGLYRYVFDLPATPINARPRKTKGGFKTKTEAKKAAKEFEKEYILGLTDTNDDILYCDYLDFWLKKMKKDKSPSTIRNYDKVIRVHLKPKLGDYTLKALKRLILEEFLKELVREGYKPNTVDNIKSVLTGSIRYAYLHDMVDGPVDNVISKLNFSVNSSRIKKKSHSTQQKNEVISYENIQKLLMRFPEGESSHIPIMLGYHLGLRAGEAYGIRWNNINFENNTVCVDGQVIYDDEMKEWFYREPKKNSKRIISMDNELREFLLREKARQEENKKSNKYVEVKIDKNKMINYFEGENANFVVHHKYGGFISSNAKMNIANVAHKELNIPFTFHSLRHTHCTYLADNGVDLYYLYQRMGHKSIKTTMKYYVDSTDTLLKNNFEQLNSLFGSKQKGSE